MLRPSLFATGLAALASLAALSLSTPDAHAQRHGRRHRVRCDEGQHASGDHCCNNGEEWVPARDACVCLAANGCAPVVPPSPVPEAPPPPPPPRCPNGMALIENADFTVGAAPSVTEAAADERPVHRVTLAPYCIDRGEVTVAQYRACAQSGSCTSLPTVNLPGLPPGQVPAWSQLCNGPRTDRDDHPMNCVDWTQADAFCRSRGARLPTEAEWEFAARGSEMRTYPWGDAPPGPERTNACRGACAAGLTRRGLPAPRAVMPGDDGFAETSPVGRFAPGLSPYGLTDMAGNVMEWTADWFGPYSPIPATNPTGPGFGQERVVRGGHWGSTNAADLRTTRRQHAPPGTRLATLGFRCVATPAEPPPPPPPPPVAEPEPPPTRRRGRR